MKKREKIIFGFFHPAKTDSYTPLDLGYLAALIQKNFDVQFVELSFSSPKNSLFFIEQDAELLAFNQPKAVFFFLDDALWSGAYAFERAKKIAKALRKTSPEIFIGFQSYKFKKEEIEESLQEKIANCVIERDPEGSFLHLEKILKKEKVAGVIYLDIESKKVLSHKEAEHPKKHKNLDYLPSPYLEGVFDNFLAAKQVGRRGKFKAFLYFSRGCPFGCFYCFRSVKQEKIRFFSPKRCYDEIEYLFSNFGIRLFFIIDDSFSGAYLHKNEFLEEFEKRKRKIPELAGIKIMAMVRPEMISEDIARFFKKINIHWIQIGLQTVNPDLQKYMTRRMPIEKFEDISKWFQENDIKLHLDVVIGLPGDTFDWLKKTVDFALFLKPFSVQVNQLYLNPHTKFFNEKDEYEIETSGVKREFFTPFITRAKGEVGPEYFQKSAEYIEEKIKEHPEIGWKLVMENKRIVTEKWLHPEI